MTDRPQPHAVQGHTTPHRYETGAGTQHRYEGGVNTLFPEKGPSTPQVLAIVTGLPIGGTLLALAGLTLAGTLFGLAVTTPLFILFSPVLVPATIVIGLAVAGFLTSGACGLTALSSFSWVMNYIRQVHGTVPDQLESAKQRLVDVAGYVGQKTKEVGQENKAQDAKRT